MRKKVLHFLVYWLPLIIWAVVVFFLSAQPGGEVIKLSLWQTFIRKGFHALEYGLGAFLFWRFFYSGYKLSEKKSFWAALFLTVLFAISDEWHQDFVLNRNGNWWDVLLDSLAALLVLQSLRVFWAKRKIIPLAVMLIVFSSLMSLMGWMIAQTWELKKIHGDFLFRNSLPEKESVGFRDNDSEIYDLERATEFSDSEDEVSATLFSDSSENNSDIEEDSSSFSEEAVEDIFAIEPLPDKIFLTVPFTSQAPFGQWDKVHEEACEEASLLMIKYFLDKRTEKVINKQEAEDELQKMKNFQVKEYGKFEDSTMEEVVDLAQSFYQINNLEVVYDFEAEDLKRELAKGSPVIVPTAGRELGNPYYTPPGPLYHNLVLIGYKNNRIITNDPGTRRGQNMEYDLQKLYSAVHDFPGDKNKIKQGRKAMIVVR